MTLANETVALIVGFHAEGAKAAKKAGGPRQFCVSGVL